MGLNAPIYRESSFSSHKRFQVSSFVEYLLRRSSISQWRRFAGTLRWSITRREAKEEVNGRVAAMTA